MCEKPTKIGIIKKINIPFIVISWCRIKIRAVLINDTEIKNSSLFK